MSKQKLFASERLRKKFWGDVDSDEDQERCWPWMGFRTPEGYGRFYDHGCQLVASRVAWELHNNEALGERMACHHCDNPICCNPHHIYAGDAKSNATDAAARNLLNSGRQCGESHTSARMTWNKVDEVRARMNAGETPYGLASEYGVNPNTLRKIRDNVTWNRTERK